MTGHARPSRAARFYYQTATVFASNLSVYLNAEAAQGWRMVAILDAGHHLSGGKVLVVMERDYA